MPHHIIVFLDLGVALFICVGLFIQIDVQYFEKGTFGRHISVVLMVIFKFLVFVLLSKGNSLVLSKIIFILWIKEVEFCLKEMFDFVVLVFLLIVLGFIFQLYQRKGF
eukprot:TRINITY_DN6174_c1_g1_i2.p4 TRINITY_DN6174_c1_g1~~TRINITY_DN6174_c1_g1_i2.p4  ORF type:complete len:108 (-),score=6.17 TRINITY_DN6174_c1_g1_i2:193-516(-)